MPCAFSSCLEVEITNWLQSICHVATVTGEDDAQKVPAMNLFFSLATGDFFTLECILEGIRMLRYVHPLRSCYILDIVKLRQADGPESGISGRLAQNSCNC